MSYKIEKSMRIIDELVGFCCKRGANDVDIHYNTTNKVQTVITIVARNINVTDEDIQILTTALNQNRQREVEECFWLISGDDSFGDELPLVGIMLDKSEVVYENGTLTITSYREEKQVDESNFWSR
ncbi:MAG: hypothetical protein ACK5LV_05165 [Lachnospirales bacterium]